MSDLTDVDIDGEVDVKVLIVGFILFLGGIAKAGILGLWKGESYIFNSETMTPSKCSISVYLKYKKPKMDTITSIVCEEDKIPLHYMAQSFVVENNKIINQEITGDITNSKFNAFAQFSTNHLVKVDMSVNKNVMVYNFQESLYGDTRVISGTLLKQKN